MDNDIPKTLETPFLTDLFLSLNDLLVPYCVLRNYDGLPRSLTGSDLDILVAAESLNEVTRVIGETARKYKGLAIWREWNDCLRVFFCWGRAEQNSSWGVHIDLQTGIRWKGFEYYSHEYVLSRRFSRNGVSVANRADASIVGVLEKALHNSVVQKNYAEAALSAYEELTSSSRDELHWKFGAAADAFFTALKGGDKKATVGAAGEMRKVLRRHQMFSLPWFQRTARLLKVYSTRVIERPGMFVAVIGLDGAGKSTLIRLVKNDLERLLHTSIEHRHSRPGFLPPLAKLFGKSDRKASELSDPHAKPPSGYLISFIRLLYYLIDYVCGYWLSVYPVLLKRPAIVLFDRYFYDYFIDPARYLITTYPWVVSILDRFVPTPDVLIFIKPNPEVFQLRKPELPLTELRAQGERVIALAGKLSNVIWIDTAGPIGESHAALLGVVLERLSVHRGWKR